MTAALAALMLALAACGAGGTPAGQPAADPSSEAASSAGGSAAASSAVSSAAPSAPASTADAAAAFCRQLRSTGGPANAFMVIPLYSVSEAKKTTKQEKQILDGATPPAEVRRDWAIWKAYVNRVYGAARRHGAGMESMGSLANADKKAEPARHRLENYAFAHCP
jgi:hypothetical protein